MMSRILQKALEVRRCAVCGAQNLENNVQCGVCGHNLAEPKPVTSGRWKSVLLHWMTAPFVATVGILWFWFVDGWTGIFILLSSFGLAMGSLGVGPSEADTMRRRWLKYRHMSAMMSGKKDQDDDGTP